jgi:hypothetical protein
VLVVPVLIDHVKMEPLGFVGGFSGADNGENNCKNE